MVILQGGKDAEQQKVMQDRARQQEDAKNSILSQIMDQNARARCKCTQFQQVDIDALMH